MARDRITINSPILLLVFLIRAHRLKGRRAGDQLVAYSSISRYQGDV